MSNNAFPCPIINSGLSIWLVDVHFYLGACHAARCLPVLIYLRRSTPNFRPRVHVLYRKLGLLVGVVDNHVEVYQATKMTLPQ